MSQGAAVPGCRSYTLSLNSTVTIFIGREGEIIHDCSLLLSNNNVND